MSNGFFFVCFFLYRLRDSPPQAILPHTNGADHPDIFSHKTMQRNMGERQVVGEAGRVYWIFFGAQPVLSNFYPCPIVLDGVQYNCSEMVYMASKAAYFGDRQTRAKILAAKTPREQKRLGREVKGFKLREWDVVRERLMKRALLAKFSQNANLRRALVRSGTQILVEGSPYDPVWGSGLSLWHPDAAYPSRWPGANKLGQLLMAVRDDLREEFLAQRRRLGVAQL
jgi:ribA/ribD-fused uncharacterized protein